MNWTKENIPDLSGKTIVVTGGNSGIGYEAVKAFAEKNGNIILASRSVEKGLKAKEDILKENPDASIDVYELDLADLHSVHNFSERFYSRNKKLDVLLNNAGIMMNPYTLTKDGYESQLGTNHLGHFALTGLLLKALLNTPGSRIVNISSLVHKNGTMDFDNLQYDNKKDYSPMKAYGRSKIANLFFSYELQRKLEAEGKDCISLAAHPGISETNLVRFLEKKFFVRLFLPLFSMITQEASMGALPGIRACTDPDAKGGEYYGPDGKGERKGFPVVVESNGLSHNKEIAARLWKESERLTKIQFKF